MKLYSRKKLLVLAAVCPFIGAFSQVALAQGIDHGSLSLVFGEPVTTSATGKPQRVSEVPVTMEIISSTQIKRSGSNSIPGILRHVLGMDVWQWTAAGADINVRGYNAPYSARLLVLVNGRQVYLDEYGRTAWSAIAVELDEIRQIEVVKGPNTALFGFNAVSGIVNIVTFSPLYDDVNSGTVRVGLGGYREASAVKTFKLWNGGIRLSAGVREMEEFDISSLESERSYSSDPERISVAADGLWQLSPTTQFGLELTRTDVRQTEALPTFSRIVGDYRTFSSRAHLLTETDLGLVTLNTYYNNSRIALDTPVLGRLNFDNDLFVARAETLFKVGVRSSFRISGEYRSNSAETAPVGGAEIGYHVYSAGGMWDWQITDRFTTTAAARLDIANLHREGDFLAALPFENSDYDRTIETVSFNLGAVYRLSQEDTVRLTAARGVGFPSLVELGAHGSFPGFSLTGNPDIEPTVVWNFEAGYDRQLTDFDARARLSLYYQVNEDLRGGTRSIPLIPPQVPRPTFVFDNRGNSSAYGLEASIGNQGSGIRWELGYGFQLIDDDLLPTEASYDINFEDAAPRHRVAAMAGYSWGDLEFDARALYVSGTSQIKAQSIPGTRNFLVDIDDHLILDARVAWLMTPSITLAIEGQQLAESEQRQTSFPEVERRVFVSASFRL